MDAFLKTQKIETSVLKVGGGMASGPYPKFLQTFIWDIREELVLQKKVSSKGKSLLNQSISMYRKYFSLSSITMLLLLSPKFS